MIPQPAPRSFHRPTGHPITRTVTRAIRGDSSGDERLATARGIAGIPLAMASAIAPLGGGMMSDGR